MVEAVLLPILVGSCSVRGGRRDVLRQCVESKRRHWFIANMSHLCLLPLSRAVFRSVTADSII